MWSSVNVVSNECGLKWVWSQMNVVSNECMNVVSNECGLKWMYECGLKWMWSQMNRSPMNRFQMNRSQMNVVSNECGLKWKSLIWMWSQMNRSQINRFQLSAHPPKQLKFKMFRLLLRNYIKAKLIMCLYWGRRVFNQLRTLRTE